MEIADEFGEGRIVSSLEGGYNLSALARSVGAHLKALAQLCSVARVGEPPDRTCIRSERFGTPGFGGGRPIDQRTTRGGPPEAT